MTAATKERATISKIVLEIGRKTIELTPSQASELHEALDKMFGEKTVEKHVHHDYYPYWPWRKYSWSSNSANLVARYDNKTQAVLCSVK